MLVSISSVGAGAVGVTALLLLYPRLPMARIVGSDIAHAVPLTLVAGIGHWAMGAIDWQLMGVLLTGSLPGIIIGSYCATRVPETALRLLLAATLVLVAGKLGSEEWHKALPVIAASTQAVTRRSRRLANSARPNSAIAPSRNPSTKIQNPPRRGFSTTGRRRNRRRHQRMLALDQPARDIIGDGIDDRGDVMRFGEHDAAETGVLHEAIDPLVASHQHMRDHVDPQPRRIALADAAIEQIDLVGDLPEQRIERLVENFEPRHFGVAQIDHDAGAIGGLDPRLPQRVAQPHRARSRRQCSRCFARLTSPGGLRPDGWECD